MQSVSRLLALLTLAATICFTACQKESPQATDTDNSSEVKTHTDDQNNISTGIDDVATEADAALETDTYFAGRLQTPQNINGGCGITTVVDTVSNPKTITINYNGNNCAGTHFRTGTVVLSIPSGVKWKNAGAAITLSFQNFKIKRLSDNKNITINGSEVFTNVSGGLLRQVQTLQTITHTITGNNLSITFDDGSQRNWQTARKRVFTYDGGLVLTISGTGISGSASNLAEWGTNRFGHAFTTAITNPLIFREDCSGRLTAGEIRHQGFAAATVTFGLNSSGAATACPGTGNYYYKLVWTGPNGASVSAILPY